MGILGSIGKFLVGGKTKTTSAKSTGSTDVDPYAPVIPYLTDYLSKIGNLYENTPQVSALEQSGYDQLQGVTGDTSGIDAAVKANTDTINGKYLTADTNPYLADIATRIAGIAGSTNNTTFGGRGRSGSGLAGYYAGKGVGDSLTDLYGQTYESERGRQASAIGQAPALDTARYNAPQATISAGQNLSSRPFDIAQQQGGILASIGRLGQQGTTTGTQQNYTQSNGLVGDVFNSFTNKLFGTTRSTG